MVRSTKWQQEFGGALWPNVLHAKPFSFIGVGEQARSSTGAVPTEFVYPNLQNEPVTLAVEIWSNKHRLFVLIWKPRRELLRRRRIIAA
jgi:hypothetical protein